MNTKPEAVVEFQLTVWAKQNGIDIDKVESRAQFNKAAGVYTQSDIPEGFTDYCGNDRMGRALFIETKSPAKFREVREAQYNFIAKKIQNDCFACVIDCRKRIEEYWAAWNAIPDRAARMKYLWDLLQTKKIIKKETKPKKIKVRY